MEDELKILRLRPGVVVVAEVRDDHAVEVLVAGPVPVTLAVARRAVAVREPRELRGLDAPRAQPPLLGALIAQRPVNKKPCQSNCPYKY